MKNKILINFIVIMQLTLSSGVLVVGKQPVEQSVHSEVGQYTTPDGNLPFGELLDAYKSNPVEGNYVWHIGGAMYAVTIVEDYAYVGEGYSLTILDISVSDTPAMIGRSKLLPGVVEDVAVAGGYAYVADGEGGLRIIDVSDPAKPSEVGFCDTPGYSQDVTVEGNYAYLADGSFGLLVINVSDPAEPFQVGYYITGGYSRSVAVVASYAYLAAGNNGLQVIDVSDPANPIPVSFYDTSNFVYDVALYGNYAYLVDNYLRVINITNPANPLLVSSTFVGFLTYNVEVAEDYAYVADGEGGLKVIDISIPDIPQEVGSYATIGNAWAVAVAGCYIYVADEAGLEIVDMSDPTSPAGIGFYRIPGDSWHTAVVGGYAYLTDRYDNLWVIDVSDPANPREVGFHPTHVNLYDSPIDARHVGAYGDYAYLTAEIDGLRVIDVSDPTNPIEVGYTYTLGIAYDVAVISGFAYVADGEIGGLGVIDTSDPANPQEVGWYDTPGDPQAVAASGSYAYVVDGGGWLRVIDVSDPSNPVEVGSIQGCDQSMAVAESYVYCGSSRFNVIDVSNPMIPILVGFCDTIRYFSEVAVVGDYAFITNYDGILQVIDVSNPANPIEIGISRIPGDARGVTASGSYVYIADGIGGLIILNYTELEIKVNTNTVITSDIPDPSQVGEPITVTFEVTAEYGIPKGDVTVTVEGETESCTDTLAGGLGDCEIALSDTGTYTLTATYSGDDLFNSSSSATEQHTVVKGETTTTILSDEPDPSQIGEPFEVAFELTSGYGTPSGEVTLTVEGETESCKDSSEGGLGDCEVALSDTGTYTLTATYSGDDLFNPSSSATEQHTVLKGDTTTTILSDVPDPSQVGEPITVTFEVTGDYGVPSGEVTVEAEGETESCTDTLAYGLGNCEIALSNTGTYTLTATYSGDEYYNTSISTTEQHTVTKSDTATILSDEPDPSQVSEPTTVTFEVTADYGIPSGEVTVTVEGETESCTDTLAGGLGDCEIALSDTGTYTLIATYSGDDLFNPSSSTTEQHTVLKGDTTTTILSDDPDPSQVGEPFEVTFEVTSASGTPGGKVTVTVAGETETCTDTLVGGAGRCQIAPNSPGMYTLIATYNGDEHYLSSSDVESHSVTPVSIYMPCVFRDYCPDFFDDFSNPSSGWETGEDEFIRYGYLNGEYQILSKTDKYYFMFGAPTCDRENYSVEADARWAGTPGESYGIFFGMIGDYDQFYEFDINTDYQDFGLWRWDGNDWHTIVPITTSYAIHNGTGTNHLRVIRDGNLITLEVNGVILGTWTDGNITGMTGVGILASPYYEEPNYDARFDNFRVTSLNVNTVPLVVP